MTAMTLIVQSKRRTAYLISDCATTDAAGRILRLRSKLIQMARFPAVVGVQGSVDLDALGAEIQAQDPRNLSRLMQVLPECLRRAIRATEATCLDTAPGSILGILKIAAWSAKQQRPVGYVITSDPALGAAMGGVEWKVHEATSSLSAATAPANLFNRLTDCENPALFDPETQALSLVEHERSTRPVNMTPGAVDGVYRIGGGVQLAKVTRRGCVIIPCGEWPDRVGEFIQPRPQTYLTA